MLLLINIYTIVTSNNNVNTILEDLNTTRPYSIIDELMDGPPNYHIEHQTSTIFSTISYPLATMTTTATLWTINTTIPTSTPTTSHDNIQQNTTAAHMQFTTHAPLSTTTSKPPTTPPNQSTSPSKDKPFDFHFILSCSSYITNFNLPTKLAKLCRDIQHNAELSIIKLVEDHLKKQAKIKKANKNKTKNKKNYYL